MGCDRLTSQNTTVTSAAEVRFKAGEAVELGADFTIGHGAFFVVELDGTLNSDLEDLDYMHARYCSPTVGRFLSVDPVEEREPLMAPQEWNQYAYGLNNPLKWIDPDGRESRTAQMVELAIADKLQGRETFLDDPAVQRTAIVGFSLLAGGQALRGAAAGVTALRLGAIRLGLGFSVTSAPVVSDPRLQSVVGKLFQAEDTIRGGTAGAIRFTLATGQRVGGSFHIQAGLDRLQRLQSVISAGGLSGQDLRTAGRLSRDLEKALKPLLKRLNLTADQLRKALASGELTEQELLKRFGAI